MVEWAGAQLAQHVPGVDTIAMPIALERVMRFGPLVVSSRDEPKSLSERRE